MTSHLAPTDSIVADVVKPDESKGFDFGAMASSYDNWYGNPLGQLFDRAQKALVRKILPSTRRGKRLLDVGCGTGHWSAFFSSLGFDVTGVDVSPEMIDAAQLKKIEHCRFEIGDARQLPYQKDIFDVVTGMTMLEFVDAPEAVLREMCRCLKTGGRIIIGTLNRLSLINQKRLEKGTPPYSFAHMYSPKELQALLNQFGRASVCVSSERLGENESSLLGILWKKTSFRKQQHSGAFIAAKLKPRESSPRFLKTAFALSLQDSMAPYHRG